MLIDAEASAKVQTYILYKTTASPTTKLLIPLAVFFKLRIRNYDSFAV